MRKIGKFSNTETQSTGTNSSLYSLVESASRSVGQTKDGMEVVLGTLFRLGSEQGRESSYLQGLQNANLLLQEATSIPDFLSKLQSSLPAPTPSATTGGTLIGKPLGATPETEQPSVPSKGSPKPKGLGLQSTTRSKKSQEALQPPSGPPPLTPTE